MRLAPFVSLFFLLGSLPLQTACSPAPDLTGTWGWEYNENPAGSSSTMFLREASGAVTGTGFDRGVGPLAVTDTLAITGSRLGTSFGLHLTSHGGRSISYAGQLLGRDELQGTWIEAPDTAGATVVFYRR